LTAPLRQEQAAVIEAAPRVERPKLRVVQGGKGEAPRRKWNHRGQWIGEKPYPWESVPDGFMRCALLYCDGLAELPQGGRDTWVCCGNGHEYDLKLIYAHVFSDPGGATRSGLSLKELGDLGEDLIAEYPSLDGDIETTRFGRAAWRSNDVKYNFPIDFLTDCGWPVEVKTIDVVRDWIYFQMTPKAARRKYAHVAEHEYPGLLGVAVVLDFWDWTAELYLRVMTKERLWVPTPDLLLAEGVPFRHLIPGAAEEIDALDIFVPEYSSVGRQPEVEEEPIPF
jgi:hypothetical protein